MNKGKRVPPLVARDVALIRLAMPCRTYPLTARQWRGRLKDTFVIAANRGNLLNWVH